MNGEPRLDRAWIQTGYPEPKLNWLPIIGLMIDQSRFLRWSGPIVARVDAVLAERPPTTQETWGGDPELFRIAQVVARHAKREMGWSNDRFLPGDDFALVFWSHEDGLDAECAFIEIEDEIGVSFIDRDAQCDFEGTLGEFVRWLSGLCAGNSTATLS